MFNFKSGRNCSLFAEICCIRCYNRNPDIIDVAIRKLGGTNDNSHESLASMKGARRVDCRMISRLTRSGYQNACRSASGLAYFGTRNVHIYTRFDVCRPKPESKRIFTIPVTVYDTQNHSRFPAPAPFWLRSSAKYAKTRCVQWILQVWR